MARERETGDFLAMVRRMIRAGGKRVAEGDEIELADLLTLEDDLQQAIATAVQGQRAMGKSWSDIAVGAGITKQSAHGRWGVTARPANARLRP